MWGVGFTVYSNSAVIESVNGRESIGLIYGISAALSLVFSTWIIPTVINKLGNRKATGLALFLTIASTLGIRFFESPIFFAVSFILFLMAQILVSFNFDVFFEHTTTKDSSIRGRGAVVALQHVGRMLGPILAAYLTVQSGIRIPYNVSLFLFVVTGFILYFATANFKDKNYGHVSIIKSYKNVISRPGVRKPLISMILLQTFYALMVTFVPIYLADVQGMGLESLGIIFTIMLFPFVVFAYPVGKYLDGGASSRRAARYGLLIMAAATLAFAAIKSNSLIIWGVVLFMSRIGAVILETTAEGTFLRSIKEEETDLLGIMRDMQPIGYFLASLISVIVLALGNIKDIFYVVGFILVLGIITTRKKKIYANQ